VAGQVEGQRKLFLESVYKKGLRSVTL